MLQLDYDGYGTGDEWNVKKRHHYFLYDFKDWLLGAELNLRNGTWLKDIVVEYLYTKYQSGPLYHDHTAGRPEHISGKDDYYNHYIFPGWQHWGQAMGNPLYRSPIYNTDGTLRFEDTRFTAFHLGFDGQPTDALSYRVLASWQEALDFLADRAAQEPGRFLFVFDEFPYAAMSERSLPSSLQIIIDHKLKNLDLMMILCGSNEEFMENVSFVDKLKLRAQWGKVGFSNAAFGTPGSVSSFDTSSIVCVMTDISRTFCSASSVVSSLTVQPSFSISFMMPLSP